MHAFERVTVASTHLLRGLFEVSRDLPSTRAGLRFTGFVAFAVRIGSLLTGLAFSIIVARRLSEEDFGAWAYVGRLVSFFAATASFIKLLGC
jgi:hypothetical protein